MDNTPKSKKPKSMRYNHFMDLYSTETNYVGIIKMIMTEFQKPLEDMVGKKDEELLNKSELRAIFGNFNPIYEVHSQMLNHFREMQSNWKEDCLIGKVLLDHRAALLKAYPPYVNYFEQMKSTLLQCIAQNPKFHAFLKINQSKPQCGRQTLPELLIQPVQRLPFMGLLIKDILKHTPKSNPDHKELEKALNAIKDVNNYINEDKRKTEGYTALLNIINDIDNCPASLLSSNRRYISECEVTELTKCLGGRDDRLMIFLFTDYIEICKIREARGKPYKHIRLIPLNIIPCVYDIKDGERVLAIEVKDEILCFKINEKHDKMEHLKNISKQLAENAKNTEYEQYIKGRESHELGVDINLGTLKKVRDYAKTFFLNE